ncbi:low molecular weight phosphotyrosine protein phosphatase-like protein [Trichodelitschia bisporula]|uniref:Low molecular weight phosphotyrosine protein phosphatase-like protein n=1 Tax=Trichodelitschia bisporula TaxID=703511 RepID=A0A6G1HUH6_9PEZI|nr:low molecular weight phosphotyrosine protein phosphatase-like protein [Trichodelitschia bisporula]
MSETSAASSKPQSVLFVCLGNICRSPMAEAVFRHLTPSHPLVGEVDSAGTGAWHAGSSPDPRTMRTLQTHGVQYSHSARQAVIPDFEEFDWIFAMDRDNLEELESMREKALRRKRKDGKEAKLARLMLFGDWGGSPGEVVIDPYYGGNDGFDVAYEQMVRFSKGFLKALENGTAEQTGNS